MNKKGAIVEDLTDFLFLVFAAFFSLAFIGLALGQVEDQNAMAVWDNLVNKEANVLLNSYLSSPVEVEGEVMTIENLLYLWDGDRIHYKNILEEKTIIILNNFAGEKYISSDMVGSLDFSIQAFTSDPAVQNQNLLGLFAIHSRNREGFCTSPGGPGNFCKFPAGKTITTSQGTIYVAVWEQSFKVNT